MENVIHATRVGLDAAWQRLQSLRSEESAFSKRWERWGDDHIEGSCRFWSADKHREVMVHHRISHEERTVSAYARELRAIEIGPRLPAPPEVVPWWATQQWTQLMDARNARWAGIDRRLAAGERLYTVTITQDPENVFDGTAIECAAWLVMRGATWALVRCPDGDEEIVASDQEGWQRLIEARPSVFTWRTVAAA